MRCHNVVTATFIALIGGAAPAAAQSHIDISFSEMRRAEASSVEGGGFMEFIHKLSGPRFKGWMWTASTGLAGGTHSIRTTRHSPLHPRLRLRLSGGKLAADDYVSSSAVPDTSNLTAIVLRGELEYRLASLVRTDNVDAYLDVGAGYSHFIFGGDADTFWNYSIPLKGQLRFVLPDFGSDLGATFRISGGFQRFNEFATDAFLPAIVTGLNTSGAEWVGFWTAGVEVHR